MSSKRTQLWSVPDFTSEVKDTVERAIEVVGVDAGKWRHRIFVGGQLVTVENKAKDLRKFLKGLPENSLIGVESTATYHRLLADLAYKLGFKVYVLNAKKTAAFKRASGLRGKTDNIDAKFIARYVALFGDSLHPYVPYPERLGLLRCLVSRRVKIASRKHDVQMSLRGTGLKKAKDLFVSFDEVLAEMDKTIEAIAKEFSSYKRLLKLPGVGPLVAAGLLAVLEHLSFATPESFVAYCGLDPRPFESGERKGQRKLSKFGDACLRRLLFLAAMSGQKCKAWKAYYKASLERGLTKITGLIRISRRIARLAWFAAKQGLEFDERKLRGPLDTAS